MAAPRHRFTLLLAVLVALLAAAPAGAQVIDRTLWGTNGGVSTIARSGNTLFIGGGFSTVGPVIGCGAPLDLVTGAPRPPFPLVNGGVNAVVPDGAGGWYIGGRFSMVDGAPRAGLAHILADGTVADWGPAVAGTGYVLHTWHIESRSAGVNVIVLHGRTLFVAGLFQSVAGRTRHNLAAVDAVTGALLDWDPDVNDEVYAMVVHGHTVYLGGHFTTIGAQARPYIGAVDARTGTATDWSPAANDRVQALAVSGNSVWAGGDFAVIGGQSRNTIAELDAKTGLATAWDAAIEPHRYYVAHGDWVWPAMSALAVEGRTVYAGGRFDSSHGKARGVLAAFDARTGEPTEFQPAMNGEVATLAVRGPTLYVGGLLYWFGSDIRPNLAALDAVTGKALAWNPRADGAVLALGLSEDAIYVGGGFSSIHDWQPRNGLAALDVTTGALLPWKPAIDGGGVSHLGVIGNTLYMLGTIHSIDGQPRGNLAAVDATTGRVTPWDPGPLTSHSYPIDHMMVTTSDAVFVGGYFSSLGGQPRSCLAELDPVTGAATAFNPGPDDNVYCMAAKDDTLYVGGSFINIAGQPHRWMAALDLTNGALLPWQPLPGWDSDYMGPPFITAMAAGDRAIYVGGTLTNMGGFPRADLAAVDATTGAILPWYPQAGGSWPFSNSIHVEALAVSGNEVWIGGSFATMHGLPRPNLAVVDGATGVPNAWEPKPDGRVSTFLAYGDTMYVGGSFRNFGGVPRSGLAAVIRTSALAAAKRDASRLAVTRVLTLDALRPNPARGATAIAFTLPQDGRAELAVYDLQGRRVAQPLDEARPAGAYEVRVDAGTWPAGVYFCRLSAGGRSVTKRLLVVH